MSALSQVIADANLVSSIQDRRDWLVAHKNVLQANKTDIQTQIDAINIELTQNALDLAAAKTTLKTDAAALP